MCNKCMQLWLFTEYGPFLAISQVHITTENFYYILYQKFLKHPFQRAQKPIIYFYTYIFFMTFSRFKASNAPTLIIIRINIKMTTYKTNIITLNLY